MLRISKTPANAQEMNYFSMLVTGKSWLLIKAGYWQKGEVKQLRLGKKLQFSGDGIKMLCA